MKSTSSNAGLWERAMKIVPGPHSSGWSPIGGRVLFIVKGEGSHLWDADGKEYIDFRCAAGPSIFGHSNKEYRQALKETVDKLCFPLCGADLTQTGLELAEKFVQHVPCAEKVRFGMTGTEVVQLVIRLARAHTKRRYFIRFEGHYHGWMDNVLGGTVNDAAIGKPLAVEGSTDSRGTEGRDPAAFEQSFLLPWNDIEVLERVLEKYGEEVALIHMEPINVNRGCCPPRPGYLKRVRELCTKYGIVLSFDEVITGFRVALNSAQGKLAVKPDIATFGKAIGGGLPFAAIAGQSMIMDLLLEKRVNGAGTFNGYNLGISASLASIKILERDNGAFYKKIDAIQLMLVDGLRGISKRYGIPMLIQGDTGFFYIDFIDHEVAYSARDLIGADKDKKTKFIEFMAEQGILPLTDGRFYVCSALTEADVDKTLACADRAMKRL